MIDKLLESAEPGVRYRTLTDVLGRPELDAEVRAAREAIEHGPTVRAIFDAQHEDGRFGVGKANRTGHALFLLGELRVPGDDARIRTALGHAFEDVEHWRGTRTTVRGGGPKHWPVGRMHGATLYGFCRFGLARDERAKHLARVIEAAQFADGGWHFKPYAAASSFDESSLAMRGLFAFAAATRDKQALAAATRSYAFYAEHGFVRSTRTGNVLAGEWLKLHWPHGFDVLYALEALSGGGLEDPRFGEALDLVDQRRSQDGLWRPSPGKRHETGVTDLDPDLPTQMLTVRALTVLRAAGRSIEQRAPSKKQVRVRRTRSETLLALLADAGLDTEVRSVEQLDRDHLGSHSRVTLGVGESYLLREFQTTKSAADFLRQREAAMYALLEKAGLPVPRVLSGVEGSWGPGGDPSAMLLTDVAGTPLEVLAAGELRPAIWREVGALLRRLHEIDPSTYPSVTRSESWGRHVTDILAKLLQKARATQPAAVAEIRALRPALQAYLDERPTVIRCGIRWGGSHKLPHMLFAPSGKQWTCTGWIDWGFASLGDPMWDVVVLVRRMEATAGAPMPDAFFKAYGSHPDPVCELVYSLFTSRDELPETASRLRTLLG